MREFFRGWRRKAGLATLAMALLVLTLWFRSHAIADIVSFDEFDDYYSVETGGGNVVWSRTNVRYDGGIGCRFPSGLSWDTRPYQTGELELPAVYRYSVRRRLIGAEFSIASHEHRRDNWASITTVSFWKLSLLWLTMPLTLLSALLLLIKPRPAKSAKESSRA